MTDATLPVIRNVSMLPEPEASPITSSPANAQTIKDIKARDKRAADNTRKVVA